jgi:Ca2+-binding RTX toxin-like protein
VGNDLFVFNSLTISTERDTVRDFVRGEDLLSLSSSVFTALGAMAGGTLAASAFVNGNQATNADQRLVYNATSGNLFYDADGNGAGAMVQIAFFSTHPPLSNVDFQVT